MVESIATNIMVYLSLRIIPKIDMSAAFLYYLMLPYISYLKQKRGQRSGIDTIKHHT